MKSGLLDAKEKAILATPTVEVTAKNQGLSFEYFKRGSGYLYLFRVGDSGDTLHSHVNVLGQVSAGDNTQDWTKREICLPEGTYNLHFVAMAESSDDVIAISDVRHVDNCLLLASSGKLLTIIS